MTEPDETGPRTPVARGATHRKPARRSLLAIVALATLTLLTSLLAAIAPTPAAAQDTYAIDLAATVPFVNSGDGTNVFQGVRIQAIVEEDSGNADECVLVATLANFPRIDAAGTALSDDGWRTAFDGCGYDFFFPVAIPATRADYTSWNMIVEVPAGESLVDKVVSGETRKFLQVDVDDSSSTASVTYKAAARINVTVPFVDDAGTNVFADTEIDVTVAAGASQPSSCATVGPAASDPANNPDIVSPITLTIGDTGTSLVTSLTALIASGCSYVFTFPDTVEATNDNTKSIARTTPATVTATDATTTIDATYLEVVADLPISITVPFVDDGTGANVYSGAVIAVTVAPGASQPDTCAAPVSPINVTIGDTGTIATVTIDSIGTGCSYVYTFPATVTYDIDNDMAMDDPDDRELTRTSAETFTATDSSPGITAEYGEFPATFLGPGAGDTAYTVAIEVPEDDYTGTQITATYVPTAASPAGCTTGATNAFVADADGNTTLAGGTALARLANKPAGFTSHAICAYDLTFATANLPDNVDPLPFNAPTGTTALSRTNTAYTANLSGEPNTTFMPDATITAPAAFNMTVIEVTYSTTIGSHSTCRMREFTEEYTVGSDGSTTRISPAAAPVELIDKPGGSPDGTHCSYDITFEAEEDRTYGGILDETPTTLTGKTLDSGSPIRSAGSPIRADDTGTADEEDAYIAELSATDDTVFTPTFTFEVGIPPDAPDDIMLDDYVDVVLKVVYTAVPGAHDAYMRCTATDQEYYLLKLMGSGDTARLVAEFDNTRARNVPAILIDHPEGPSGNLQTQVPDGTNCQYTVEASYDVGSSGSVNLETPEFFLLADTWVAAVPAPAAPSATGAATHFMPTVNITVPRPTSGRSAYAGIQFNVTFAPVATSHAGCSPATTSVYQVIANPGADPAPLVEIVGLPARLVNLPAGGTASTDECSYDVTIALADSRERRLQRTGNPTATISEAASTATDEWVVQLTSGGDPYPAPSQSGNATDFEAKLRIYVPDNTFAGIQFTVTFAPVATAPVGCSPATSVIYEVDSNGVVGVADFNLPVRLVNVPAGGSAYTDDCFYDVTIAPTDSREMRLERDGSAPTTLRSRIVSGTATALAGDSEPFFDTTFTADISFTFSVPEDAPTRFRPRDFAGQMINVRYSVAQFQDSNCAASGNESYELVLQGTGANATLVGERQGDAAELVDHPGAPTVDDDVRCTYNVFFSYVTSDNGLANPESSPDNMVSAEEAGDRANAVEAIIQPEVVTTFAPTTVFNFPTGYMTQGYGPTVIEVSYSIASGSAIDCTLGATETFDVAADGTYTSRGDLGKLAHAVPAQEDACAYSAVATKYIAGGKLGRSSGAQNVTVVSDTATFVYTAQTTFSPSTTITLPADFTGATVDVGYAAHYELGFDITLPFIDDGDSTNVFETTEITANVAAAAGNPQRCSDFNPPATLSGTVGASASGEGTATLSVDHTGSIPAECAYVLTFAPSISSADSGNASNIMTTQTTTVPVNAGFPRAQVTYTSHTTFTPTVNIVLNGNILTGLQFLVEYFPVVGAAVGCSTVTEEIYEVGPDGTVGLPFGAQAVSLIDLPVGGTQGTDNCAYQIRIELIDPRDVRLDRDPAGTAMTTISSATEVSAAEPAVTDTWIIQYSTFTPTVNISVPPTETVSGTNDFAGILFTVSFTPAADARSDCSPATSVIYEVGTGGTVAVADIGPAGANTAAELVDLPAGAPESMPAVAAMPSAMPPVEARPAVVGGECSYDVAVALTDAREMRLERSGSVPGSVRAPTTDDAMANVLSDTWAATSTTTAPAAAAGSTFDPTVNIVVPGFVSPNTFAGIQFSVSFSPAFGAHAGCTGTVATPTSVVYEIGSAGTVGLATTSTAATLVNLPAGAIPGVEECSYDVLVDLVDPSERRLVRFLPAPLATSAEASAVDTDWRPAPDMSWVAVCTAGAAETYEADAAGATTRTMPVDSGGAPIAAVLVDTPQGEDTALVNCSYEVSITDTTTTGRSLEEDAPTITGSPIDAANPSAMATLEAAAVTYFTGDIDINIPAGYGGSTVTVTYAPVLGSNAGCTGAGSAPDVSETYDVANDRSVTIDGSAQQLVDTPEGALASVRCSYDVAFAIVVVGGRLVIPPSVTGSPISALSRAASATYVDAPAINFRPTANIMVPVNFGGTTVAVTYSRVSGSNGGCTASASETYSAANDRMVTRTGNQAQLVGTPAGEATSVRCSYDVTFAATPQGGMLSAPTVTGSPISAAASTASVSFTGILEPDVTITFPDLDRIAANPNDFEGLQLTATYTPVAGSDARCQSGTEDFTVDATGLAVRDNAAVRLIGTPVDAAGECVYLVGLPAGVLVPSESDDGTPAAPVDPGDYEIVLPEGDLLVSASSPLVVAYLDNRPRPEAEFDDSLYRVAGGKGDIPVRVAVRVPTPAGQIFSPRDAFEVHVNVPGICGDDTLMFGGPHASDGVSYGVRAVIPGVNYAIGPGSVLVNPRAAYTLPSYVERGSRTTPCQVRVTHVKAPVGCEMRASEVDLQGRAYEEITWTQGLTSYEFIMDYDCDTSIGRLALIPGWMMLPFNGETGTTPQSLAQTLRGAISSVWVWDTGLQNWRGWAFGHGNLGLDQLTKGDIIVVYSPRDALIEFMPLDLFDPPAATGSRMMQPIYSLQVVSGTVVRDLDRLFGDEPGSILVLFRWDAAEQDWEYYLPGRAPVDTVDIEWFDLIVPRDVVFAYNAVGVTVTIPWS